MCVSVCNGRNHSTSHKKQPFSLHITLKQQLFCVQFVDVVQIYRIAGSYRGRKLSRIGGKMEFCGENFGGLHACTYCVDRAFKQSRRKLSLMGTKQRNSQKISPSKVSCYTVLYTRTLTIEYIPDTCIMASIRSKSTTTMQVTWT